MSTAADRLILCDLRECLGHGRLSENEVQPVKVGFVGICRSVRIRFERGRAASAVSVPKSAQRQVLSDTTAADL